MQRQGGGMVSQLRQDGVFTICAVPRRPVLFLALFLALSLKAGAGTLPAAKQAHRRVAFEKIEAGSGCLPACFAQATIPVDQQMGVVPRRVQ